MLGGGETKMQDPPSITTSPVIRPPRHASRAGVSKREIAAYSGAAFATMFLSQPVINFVPQLYAKELGIGLGGLGIALFVGRILNAVVDQLVGYLSDRTRTRWGARKPWVVAGATLTVISAFFLLKPSPGIGLLYFFIWRLTYDVASAMVTISYTAWGAELSADYDTRSRVAGYRGLASQLGSVLNHGLPILVAAVGLTATAAYSMEMMGWFFVVALVTIPLTTLVSVVAAPQGPALPQERPDFRGLLVSVRRNRPFWIYLASFMTTGIGLGVLQLMFTFYDGYLRMGTWFPYVMTAFAIATLVGIPLWSWAALRIGKHRAYSLSMVVASLAMNGFWFVTPGVTPMSTLVPMAFVVLSVMGLGVAGSMTLPAAILADVVDYGTLKTGEVRTGSYFAFYTLTSTIAMAIGAALGFMLLSAFGYDAKVGAINGATAQLGMMITVVAIPTVLKIGGALMVWHFPIDARAHSTIRRRLAELGRRSARDEVLAVAPGALVDPETPAGRVLGTA
jgi:Na+/melibiose symporter-like transporter